MKTKYFTAAFLSFVAISLAVGFVSAADGSSAASSVQEFMSSAKEITEAVLNGIEPIFAFLLGPQSESAVSTGSTSFMIVELLLLVIVFALIYTILDSFDFFSTGKPWVLWVVSIAASILSVRFMSEEWINTILLPYQALGVTLTAIVPFVIYFIFVEIKLKNPHGTPFLRKFLWIFFAVVFLVITISREWKESANAPSFAWVYIITIVVALLMIWVDGTIQKWIVSGKIDKAHSRSKSLLIRQLHRDLDELDSDFRAGRVPRADWERETRRIKADIEALAR